MENGNFQRFSFGLADYALLGVVVSVSIVIGLYHAFRRGDQKTVSEYLVGNRKMKVVPVAVSLLVTFQSSTLLIGLPAEMYVYGTMLWLFVLTAISANTLSAIFIVPLFQPLKLTSAYEYLELRFESRWVRRLGSILGILGNTWYCGVVLYGPAIVIESVTGTPIWASIIIIAASGIFYTAIGGYKAVIWTDVFQFTVMISGMLAVIIKGAMSVGGLGEMWRIADEGRRIQFFNFNPDPTVRNTFWCLVIGGTVKKFGYNLSQSAIQRMSSMETVRKAQGMVLLAIPGFVLFGTLACLEGLLAYAYFAKSGCDPLEAKIIKSPNEVIPYFVMELFHTLPGVPGLFLSSVFCAALSSLSSCLNGISAMVSEDFVLPFYPQIRERTRTIMAKLTVLVFGLLSVGVAFLASHARGPLYQIASVLMSSFGGALTGLFLLGALFSSVNSKGAVVGGLFGFAFSFWVSLGGAFSENIPRTPYLRSPGTEFCSREINHHLNYTQVPSINTTEVPPFYDLYNSTYVPEVTDFSSAFNTTDTTDGFNSTSTCTTVSPLLKLYSLSYMWLYALAVLLTLITGIITSYITGANKEGDVDPKYLISFRDKISVCLPRSRKQLTPQNHVDKELIVGFSTPPSGSDSCPGRGEGSRDRLLSHPNGSASAKL